MIRFIIDAKMLQGIVNYLAARPYSEVFQIIPLLQKLPEYTEPKD